MVDFYAGMQNTATQLITDKGQSVVITHTEEGAYDPTTGLVPSVKTTQTSLGVLLDHGSREIDGTVIVIGDKKLLLSGKALDGTQMITPQINDTVVVDSVNYTIKAPLKELKPNGTVVIMYTLNLRV